MFTGLVEETGEVLGFQKQLQSWRLRIRAEAVAEGLRIGDSVAVNGCCLSAIEINKRTLVFDVLEETRRLTNLKGFDIGTKVNLERSLQFDGRVGGHFLTGHIDGVGTVRHLRHKGRDVLLNIEVPETFSKYLVYKGCIAIDGISLTVAEAEGRDLGVWLIPHTLEVTNLGGRKTGDSVNLEFDLLAKYTEKILSQQDR